MASHSNLRISEDHIFSPLPEISGRAADPRVALAQRVLGSSTFEHSPKLRTFLDYVCRCALDSDPAAATEPQIGIHVFGRAAGYSTNDDNIVRSQARFLRLKLEHHFANEGKDEPVVITIPKGRYLPVFESRFGGAALQESGTSLTEQENATAKKQTSSPLSEIDKLVPAKKALLRWFFFALILALLLIVTWVARIYLRSKRSAIDRAQQSQVPAAKPSGGAASRPAGTEIRIAAGNTGDAFTNVDGKPWTADDFYHGGASEPGPEDLFPPVSHPELFRRIREGVSLAAHAPSGFRYDIPVSPGVYELRLYFADPIRRKVTGHDGQHLRHFQVNLNGNPILTNFDAVADAGTAAVDIRAFKDVSPAEDGKIHLEFLPSPDLPFLSTMKLSPGVPGKLVPIRITAHSADLVDPDGTRWSGDEYFIDGNTLNYSSPEKDSKIPPLYTDERFGNFSYAIPVPPGTYTLRLHFMESFFDPSAPSGLCWGAGCRVFDVTCNGETLLSDFDIFKVAGDYRPVIRTFHGLHPNGQGKLLISFSPKTDYAEIRAIEVIDEGPDGQQHKSK